MRRLTAIAPILTLLVAANLASAASVDVPVLGLYAENSRLANRDGMKRLYSNLEYHEIAGTGHFLMMEKPEEFNQLLSTFLAKVQF